MKEINPSQANQVKNTKRIRGFTLIELLVAVVMSSIVMAALGAGMMAVLNSSKTSEAKADVKNQLNRAIEYINEDIRRSRVAGVSTVNDNGTTRNTVVFTYFENINDTTGNTISYYIDEVDANSPWLGPQVLRRQVNDENWQVLVDRLSDNNLTADVQIACNSPEIPLATTISGFQACLESVPGSNGTNIYRTTISLIGEISNNTTVQVSTDTISRSITPDLAPPVLQFTPETDLTPTLTWETILGAQEYIIYRCETVDPVANPCDPPAGDVVYSGGNATTVTDNYDDSPAAAPYGNHYCYAGVSLNGSEQGLLGESVCTIKSPASNPTDVSDAEFDVSNDVQPTLTWTRKTDAVDYEIYRCEDTTDDGSPCTIDTTNDLIFEFTAATDAAFDNFEPWFEERNTNQTPPEGSAFCYAVLSRNARGPSGLSSVECGAINQPLRPNAAWIINFTNFDTTQVEPQGITWNTAPTGTPEYELYRCQTQGSDTTCTVTTSEDMLVQKSTLTTFNESISDPDNLRPTPGQGYCYAVRAISSTEVGPLSTPVCAEPRPEQCELNIPGLGFDIPQSFQPSDSDTARGDLLDIVNAGASGGETFSIVTVNEPNTALGTGILHTLQANGVDVAPSSTSRFLPCNTEITLRWDASDIPLSGPVVSITPPSPLGSYEDFKPRLTWTSSPDTSRIRVLWCKTSNPTDECIPPTTPFLNRPGTDTAWDSSDAPATAPASGERTCFTLVAFVPARTEPSNIVCGAIR